MSDIIADRFALVTDEPPRQGGLSVVRKAVDLRRGKLVAVKFVTGANDELSRKVFERESRNLRALSHENIVRFHHAGIDDTGTYYIVLDWVEANLDERLKASAWSDWAALYEEVGRPVLSALAYAHLNHVEHRDIKPQNILLDENDKPLLADFGISKLREDSQGTEHTVAAFRSRPYAPPEFDGPLAYVRDVYSLAVVFVQCLTPDRLTDRAGVEQAFARASIPPDVRSVLAACLDSDASRRPANASLLADSLARTTTIAKGLRREAKNPLFVRITRSAAKALDEDSADAAVARARLIEDLSDQVHASYRFNHESGQHDRSTVILVGTERRYVLKRESDGSRFVLVATSSPEYEVLERLRQRSVLVPPLFDWIVRDTGSKEVGIKSVQALEALIDDYLDSAAEEGTDGDPDANSLFETWLRVLDAREDLARGQMPPLQYDAVLDRDHEAVFSLKETIEQDLVGTEWQVREPQTGRTFGWGEVVDQRDADLTLLATHLQRPPRGGQLVPHVGPSEVSLARQRDALTAVRDASSVAISLGEILVRPESNEAPTKVLVDTWDNDLDQSKKDAVQTALGAPKLLLVQGPPGTGKTTFISELVSQTLLRDPSSKVLLASQTHVAVDNALERMDARGLQGLVRLAGADESRVDASVRHLLLDAQTRRWAEQVRQQAEDRIEVEAQAAGHEPRHVRAALALQHLAGICAQLEALARQSAADQQEVNSSLTTAFEADPDELDVDARVRALEGMRNELLVQVREHLAGDLTLPDPVEPSEARAAVDALLGGDGANSDLLTKLELQSEWLQRIEADDSLATVYLATASVVAGTCTGFLRHRAARPLEFDLCILDEASKATLTEALVPMSRARRWTLVGDTRQLPPSDEDLLLASEVLEEHNLQRSDVVETLFQRCADRLPKHSQLMLTEQYRMIRPIGDLVSTCFYDGELLSPLTEGIPGYRKVQGREVLWLDTSHLGERRREIRAGGHGTSFANRTEARIALNFLQAVNGAIRHEVIRSPKVGELTRVLLIAPYRSQVEELRRRVSAVALDRLAVDVISVDAVQGKEADIAVLSLTRSNPEGRLGFLGPEYWRRINVALSRARFGLTIIGDAAFVRSSHGALKTVLEYMRLHTDDCEVRSADGD